MPWPSSQEYVEALQFPESSFDDPDLRSAEVTTDKHGIPKPISGNFATVFTLQNGKRQWAVRCFSRELSNREQRYTAITQHLKQSGLQCMVDFAYLPNGVKVNGRWYPILKMEWIKGVTLDQYVKAHLNDGEKLQSLTEKWVDVCEQLRNARIVHGDLQHGNIIVTDGGEIKLIDYDGIILQDIVGFPSNEIGHRHYQHPSRQLVGGINNENFLGVDNFSAHVIASSLTLLSIDPTLWDDDTSGDDNLLFKSDDYAKINSSPLFQKLQRHADERIRDLTDQLTSRVITSPSYLQVPNLNSHDTTDYVFPALYDLYLNLPQPIYDMNKTSWLSDHITQDGDQLYAFPEDLIIEAKRAIDAEFDKDKGFLGLSLFKPSYAKFAESYLKQHFEHFEIVLQKRRVEQDLSQLSSQFGNDKRLLLKRHSQLKTQLIEQSTRLQQSLRSFENNIRSAESEKQLELRKVEERVLEDFYSKSLRRYTIEPGKIYRIGQKRIDALNSVGITNASDIVRSNRPKAVQALLGIHGGNASEDWDKLVLWRDALKQAINVPKNLSNASEVSQVNSTYQKKVNDIKNQISSSKAQHQIQEKKLAEQIKQTQDELSRLDKKVNQLKLEVARYQNITFDELLNRIVKFTERLIASEIQNARRFKGVFNSDWKP
ncbi:MAG: AarF/UbiB family protein, partial [Phototrophicaceae bacterium]